MKKLIVVLLLLIVAAAGGLVYYFLYRPAPHAAELVPDSTLLFLRVPNFTKAREDFRQTAAFALWEEPSVRAFLEEPLKALDQSIGAPHITNNKRARDVIVDTLQGEVFLAVTYINPLAPTQPGLIFGTDTKTKLLQTKVIVSTFERNFRKQNPTAKLINKKYLGVDYSAWQRDRATTICYGFLHSMFVITLGEDVFRDAVARFVQHRRDTPTLAGTPAFQSFLQETSADSDFTAYLNFKPITSLLGPLLAFQNQGAEALGKLAAIQSMGLSMNFTDGNIHERRITRYDPQGHTATTPITRKTLAFTSPATIAYLASASQLAQAYTEITGALAQSGMAKATAAIADFERDVRRGKVRLQEDLLQKLGPEAAWVLNWRESAEVPDLAYVTELKDAATARPAFDKVFDVLAPTVLRMFDLTAPWDETSYRGHTLRSLVIGAGTIAPTYVLTDEFFILALKPDSARELLDQIAEHKPTLAANPEFQRATKPLPGQTTEFSFIDLRALYPHLTGLAQRLPESPILDMRKLPDAAAIGKHLLPFVSATTSSAEAEITHSYSPFGTPIGIVAGVVAGALANQALTLPDAPTASSGRLDRPWQNGNQMAGSQTPGQIFAAPPLRLSLEPPAQIPPP